MRLQLWVGHSSAAGAALLGCQGPWAICRGARCRAAVLVRLLEETTTPQPQPHARGTPPWAGPPPPLAVSERGSIDMRSAFS